MYGQLQFLLSADTFGFLWNYIDFVSFVLFLDWALPSSCEDWACNTEVLKGTKSARGIWIHSTQQLGAQLLCSCCEIPYWAFSHAGSHAHLFKFFIYFVYINKWMIHLKRFTFKGLGNWSSKILLPFHHKCLRYHRWSLHGANTSLHISWYQWIQIKSLLKTDMQILGCWNTGFHLSQHTKDGEEGWAGKEHLNFDAAARMH